MNEISPSLPSPPAKRKYRLRVRLLALSLAILVALLLAEFSLRLAGLNFASPYQPDDACGGRLIPHAGFWNLSEGRVYVTTNSAGWRDCEHTAQKPPGTFRIAVLGDSFAEAAQVEIDEAFWKVMERELRSCDRFAGQTVEVLNFGVSGYGTTQELQTLREHVWQYSPDLVLLAFLPGNDVRNNSRKLETDHGRPFYQLGPAGLELDLSFQEEPGFRRFREWGWIRFKNYVITHVRVASAAYRAKERVKAAWQSSRATSPAAVEAGLDQFVFAPPRDDVWREAWSITEGVIELMHSEVQAHHADFAVVVLNNAVQVHPDPAVTEQTARALNAVDLEEPERRITTLSERLGFPAILLTDPMRTTARTKGAFYHGFANTSPGSGHWNALGHQTAGQLIARELCQQNFHKIGN